MSELTGWEDLVAAAWNSIKNQIATQLPSAVLGGNLSDQSYNDEFGVCSSLNVPGGGGSAIWGDDGQGTLRLTSIKVSEFTNVVANDAKFNGLQVELPLTFSLLQVTGNYSYNQPCALYSLGKKGSKTEVKGSGTMNARAENGVLKFVLLVNNPDGEISFQLIGARTEGNRTTNFKPNGEPSNPILRWLVDVFGRGLQEKQSLENATNSFFSDSQFGRDLVAELNKIIGQARAAGGQS